MSINPTQQNIMEVFSANKQYYIDFYQRDYKWGTDEIDKLLEDLFYRFGLDYNEDSDTTAARVNRFDWYYLNAYVTNDYHGDTYIVDGQQRLTSITLILIKLFHLAKELNPGRVELIKEQIRGAGLYGPTYWMGQDHRQKILADLFENGRQTREVTEDDISHINMYRNYEIASKKLDGFLDTPHKFELFVLYFLTRVMLVRIQIQKTDDVPMVFEVINDRGVRLKPYEVLKGKLLGQIDKEEIGPYHDIWQEHVHRLQNIHESQVDTFFRFYFRSKYVDTRNDYRDFDGEYHKTIYEDKWNSSIGLKQNVNAVKQFVKKDLAHFADLYAAMVEDSADENAQITPFLYFNRLNNQDRQFLLVLSACEVDDDQKRQKIRLITRLFDRHFSLLQLLGVYDSNRFTERLVDLNKKLRNQSLSRIVALYQEQILADISEGLGVSVTEPLEWRYFKDASRRNMGNRFLRYYFARIDHFLAQHLPGVAAKSYEDLVRKRGYKYGYDIEHILANNAENLELFANDEELFHHERNRLGALVLLQGRDNKASSNEPYLEKRRIYGRSLLWNQSLHPDFYHKHKDLEELNKKFGLDFCPVDVYDIDAIDYRQRLLFEITKLIWGPVDLSD